MRECVGTNPTIEKHPVLLCNASLFRGPKDTAIVLGPQILSCVSLSQRIQSGEICDVAGPRGAESACCCSYPHRVQDVNRMPSQPSAARTLSDFKTSPTQVPQHLFLLQDLVNCTLNPILPLRRSPVAWCRTAIC